MEDFQSVVTNRSGNWGNPVSAEMHYMVFVTPQAPGILSVEEIRQPLHSTLQPIDDFADQGTTALALIFHPDYQGDFDMKCEGLGYWNHQPAWIVHFVQRPDRPRRIRGFLRNWIDYPLSLKGRAWIAPTSGQIMHLETDLAQPVPAIRLKREHIAVDYQPVHFAERKIKLWLPQNVDIYIDYGGRYIHQYKHYHDFKLFWVASRETIGRPQGH